MTFQCYDHCSPTRPHPYIEHAGLATGSLDIDLTLLDELARCRCIEYLELTVHTRWDQRSVGPGRFTFASRDIGGRQYAFQLTARGLALGRLARIGKVRDLVDWEPAGWSWSCVSHRTEALKLDVDTARVESATVTRSGIELVARDGAIHYEYVECDGLGSARSSGDPDEGAIAGSAAGWCFRERSILLPRSPGSHAYVRIRALSMMHSSDNQKRRRDLRRRGTAI
jgi:hypothetical protein